MEMYQTTFYHLTLGGWQLLPDLFTIVYLICDYWRGNQYT